MLRVDLDEAEAASFEGPAHRKEEKKISNVQILPQKVDKEGAKYRKDSQTRVWMIPEPELRQSGRKEEWTSFYSRDAYVKGKTKPPI